MRVVRCVVALGLALAAISLPVGAQEGSGTLYLTNQLNNAPSTCSSSPVYALADAADTGKAYLACSAGGSAWWAYFDHVATQDYTVQGALAIHAVFACDVPTVFAGTPATSGFRFVVFLAGENLSGNINHVGPNACTAPITVDVEYAGMDGRTVQAGQTLRIGVIFFGPSPGAGDPVKNVHLRVGEGGSSISAIGLNAAAAAPVGGIPAIEETLESASLSHSFANATSDTYILNFTTDLVNGTADFAWNATAGGVNATLADGNGTLVFSGAFNGNGSLAHAFAGAAAGTWNLTLAYADFVGDFTFGLVAPAADAVQTLDEHDKHHDAPSGNGTEEADEAGKDSPLPILAPILGLAVAAVRRRR